MSFFFFKQKTAYEMRISDWSSDVCSSDLGESQGRGEGGVLLDRVAVQGGPGRRLAEDHGRHQPAPGRPALRRPAHGARRLRPAARRLAENARPYQAAEKGLTRLLTSCFETLASARSSA